MDLTAIRAHLVDGRVVRVGERYSTSEGLARQLIAWGKAVPAEPAPKPKKTPMTTQTAGALVPGAGG